MPCVLVSINEKIVYNGFESEIYLVSFHLIYLQQDRQLMNCFYFLMYHLYRWSEMSRQWNRLDVKNRLIKIST